MDGVDVHVLGPTPRGAGVDLVRDLLPGRVLGRACAGCGSSLHGGVVVSGGPPRWSPAWASVSHAPAATLVAISSVGPVGVDLEPLGTAGRLDAAVVRSPLEPAHPAAATGGSGGTARGGRAPGNAVTDEELVRVWCRKEAALKALGLGLSLDPRSVVLDPLPQDGGDGSGQVGAFHVRPVGPWGRVVDLGPRDLSLTEGAGCALPARHAAALAVVTSPSAAQV